MVMGAIVTAVGGTGIFAVFTDRATQGTNTITSGSRPHAADIQLAKASPDQLGNANCGPFSDDLTTQMWTVSDFQPNDNAVRYMCVKNAGSAPFTGSLTTVDLVNSDGSCTGDESTVDPTCGSGVGAGQLASVLQVGVGLLDCDNIQSVTDFTANLGQLSTTPIVFASNDPLPPGVTGCLAMSVSYPLSTPEANIQAAQSDSVSWKFAFDVAAVE